MWSSWSEKAAQSLTQALEKTGDVISKAATNAGKQAQHQHQSSNDDGHTQAILPPLPGEEATAEVDEEYPTSSTTEKQKELLKSLQLGWSSVVETTKASIKVASEKIEQEQTKLALKIKKAQTELSKRDPSLPLDVPALKDAEVVYLTDRLITMSHPAMASAQHPNIITGERKLAAVGHLLQQRHDGRFLVWNLSEVEYNQDIFNQQVLTFSFPGSPSPPLGLLLKLLLSMESWLKADDRNVAVVHCLTGKGRTSTVMAAFLCWMGEAGFADIYQALAYIAQCKCLSVEELTIPSQRRYTSYFKNMLDSVRPSQPPLLLKRIILSEAPRYAKGPSLDDDQKSKSSTSDLDEKTLRMGCAPYLQVFKAGKLLHTAPASLNYQQPDATPAAADGAAATTTHSLVPPPVASAATTELPFCQVADGSIRFDVDTIVQGDILIRCRHLTFRNQRVSMFRAAFHTGYVPPKVMRLSKSQLDGACNDDRFSDDFFMDLIFEPVDAQTASELLQQQQQEEEDESSSSHHESTHAQALAGGDGSTTTYRASAYDAMLHRDSRFWDVIAARRQAHQEQQQQQQQEATVGDDAIKGGGTVEALSKDPNWGPTVGRRRDFSKKKRSDESNKAGSSADASSANSSMSNTSGSTAKSEKQKAALETFSIFGGDFDFLPETIEPEHAAAGGGAGNKPKPKAAVKQPKKRDTLMEALMGALDDSEFDDHDGDDENANDEDVEEIVFGTDHEDDDAAAAAIPDEPEVTMSKSSAESAAKSAESTAQEVMKELSVEEKKTNATTAVVVDAVAADVGAAPPAAAPPADAALLMDEMDEILADAVGDDDADGGDDLLLDMDDAELDDLENMLSPK